MELDDLLSENTNRTTDLSEEFSSLRLGDARLERRLSSSFEHLMSNPGNSIPEQCGSWAASKAFYRLLDQDSLTAESVLAAHGRSTIERARKSGEKVFLAIQDTTSLNFTSRQKLEGLGDINGKGEGLHAHSTMLCGADSGHIYGLLGSKLYAREKPKRATGPASIRNREPIQSKESYRWLESFRHSTDDAKLGEGFEVIHVCDREADIYELLLLAQTHRSDGLGLLVRSKHNRSQCGSEEKIWESLARSHERACMEVMLPRSRGLQSEQVKVHLRYEQVQLSVPRDRAKYQKITENVEVTIIEIRGGSPERPILWRLLTTVPVENDERAREIARWYVARWQIEVFHRVLKTGCKVESRQMHEMSRLRPMVALDMVVAIHLMAMLSLSRIEPEAPASRCLDARQIRILCRCLPGKKIQPEELNMKLAVRVIAKWGGFLGRKNDGEPGAQVLWRGMQKLHAIAEVEHLFEMP
jgi:hypothetical protein